jgi:hypothetical protein
VYEKQKIVKAIKTHKAAAKRLMKNIKIYLFCSVEVNVRVNTRFDISLADFCSLRAKTTPAVKSKKPIQPFIALGH